MPEPEWIPIVPIAEIEPDDATGVVHDGHEYAIFAISGTFHVTDALCTHNQANLCDGYLDGHIIECPLHQGCFDVRTGAPKGAPVTEALRTYESRVEGEHLEIRPQVDG